MFACAVRVQCCFIFKVFQNNRNKLLDWATLDNLQTVFKKNERISSLCALDSHLFPPYIQYLLNSEHCCNWCKMHRSTKMNIHSARKISSSFFIWSTSQSIPLIPSLGSRGWTRVFRGRFNYWLLAPNHDIAKNIFTFKIYFLETWNLLTMRRARYCCIIDLWVFAFN